MDKHKADEINHTRAIIDNFKDRIKTLEIIVHTQSKSLKTNPSKTLKQLRDSNKRKIAKYKKALKLTEQQLNWIRKNL